jgi:hypothetical protein
MKIFGCRNSTSDFLFRIKLSILLGLLQIGIKVNFDKSMSGVRVIIVSFLAAIFLSPNSNYAATSTNPISSSRIIIGQTLQPEDENRMVEVEGTVTFVSNQGHATYLEISSETGSMPVTVAHGAGYLTDLLLKSRVRVRGVCVAIHSSTDGKIVASLSATNVNDITILQLPEETWQQFPLRAIGTLTQTNFSGRVVHLRGTVQSVQPGRSILLADETGQTSVDLRQAIPEMVGMEIEALCGWHLRGTNKIFQCGIFRPLAATKQLKLPTLTTAEQIRWLKPDEANRQYPVKIKGIITFLMTRRGGNVGADIQDGTSGIFLWELWNLNPAITTKLQTGDFCEVEGVTSAGDFSPIILSSNLTILGDGQFPEPIRPNWNELINGEFDAQWIEIRGIVSSVTNRDMEIEMKGGRIQATLPRGEDPGHFLNAIVRVRGTVLASHDKERHIVGVRIDVPDYKFISIETPALADPFSIPLTHVNDLFTYNPGESDFRQLEHHHTCRRRRFVFWNRRKFWNDPEQ